MLIAIALLLSGCSHSPERDSAYVVNSLAACLATGDRVADAAIEKEQQCIEVQPISIFNKADLIAAELKSCLQGEVWACRGIDLRFQEAVLRCGQYAGISAQSRCNNMQRIPFELHVLVRLIQQHCIKPRLRFVSR